MAKNKKQKQPVHLGTIETTVAVFVNGMRVHVKQNDKLDQVLKGLSESKQGDYLCRLVEQSINAMKDETTPAMQAYLKEMMPTMQVVYPSDGELGPNIETADEWRENVKRCVAELETMGFKPDDEWRQKASRFADQLEASKEVQNG